MRVLILTDSYPPEVRSAAELMKDLALGLAGRGHDVTVVTSRPYHNVATDSGSLPLDAAEGGVRVIRPKVMPHHNVPFWMRGLATLVLPWIFFRAVRKLIRGKLDAVIVHSPPLPLAITAWKVRQRYGAKFILNLHDIFPQHAVDLGVLRPGMALRMFERMERRAYARADHIVTPSYEHKRFATLERQVPEAKIDVIPHWVNFGPFEEALRTGQFRKAYGLEGKFVFLFAGVLGPSQGLDMVLAIAERMRDTEEVRFLFVGEGREKERLMQSAAKRGLVNVLFRPLVPAGRYPWLVKDMDVGLVTLTSKNTTPAVPAKLMGYMAGALPVLGLLHKESEALRIIEESGCGYGAVSDDADRAAELAMRMYEERSAMPELGRKGFLYAKARFEREVCVTQWEKVLRNVVEQLKGAL